MGNGRARHRARYLRGSLACGWCPQAASGGKKWLPHGCAIRGQETSSVTQLCRKGMPVGVGVNRHRDVPGRKARHTGAVRRCGTPESYPRPHAKRRGTQHWRVSVTRGSRVAQLHITTKAPRSLPRHKSSGNTRQFFMRVSGVAPGMLTTNHGPHLPQAIALRGEPPRAEDST